MPTLRSHHTGRAPACWRWSTSCRSHSTNTPASTIPTRLTASCAADWAATAQSPTVAATTAKPAAGTVVTEMKTPTSAADFAETNDNMPAAPANNATTNDSGPTWKMKSTSDSSWVLPKEIQPTASPASTPSAVTSIATGKPTKSAAAARRERYIRRRTSATASAASGPNSGPTTMAPTTVTGESLTTPTAAIRHARHRNIR